jgi:hypothetical protein
VAWPALRYMAPRTAQRRPAQTALVMQINNRSPGATPGATPDAHNWREWPPEADKSAARLPARNRRKARNHLSRVGCPGHAGLLEE